MNGVSKRAFEDQPSAPQHGRRRHVAGVAGRLYSLHGGVRERDTQEQTSDLRSEPMAPVIDVNRVRDLCTRSREALDLTDADDAEFGRRGCPHKTRRFRSLPRASRLGHEGVRLLASVRTPGLKLAGPLLGRPFVDTISVSDLDWA